MGDDNTKWVESWVRHHNTKDSSGLTEREVQKAAVIGNAAFRGNMGVGHAAKAGIDAVKKLRE